MAVLSLLELAAKLTAAQHAVEAVTPEIIRAACIILKEQAQSEIGVPGWGWPPLAPDTLARKGVNTPLLEEGDLQESIAWNSSGTEGYVGTDNFTGPLHEFGTSKMPPRPFLATALSMKEADIVAMARRALAAAVAGGTDPLGELFHLLREAGHLARETIREAQEPIGGDE